ncbi:MAG: WD40/YVTN/BNR-like repeat-containing protein, partial [Gemmatimonadota bacterium]
AIEGDNVVSLDGPENLTEISIAVSEAVDGLPEKPRTYYMGAVNGGVWKTTDAGQTWRNITDGELEVAAIGAVEVAPSDRSVIWVGTGS